MRNDGRGWSEEAKGMKVKQGKFEAEGPRWHVTVVTLARLAVTVLALFLAGHAIREPLAKAVSAYLIGHPVTSASAPSSRSSPPP
jgi:hypothetical protein